MQLRIPGWCREARVTVNGEAIDLTTTVTKGYAAISRDWQNGDEIRLSFAMPVDRLYAHPAVSEDSGRVALQRGPVVYCVEETDLGGEPQRLRLPAMHRSMRASTRRFLAGPPWFWRRKHMEAVSEDWDGRLYRTAPPAMEPKQMKAIPYHLWANRSAGAMLVWLQEK
jgi:DUF1680 family protein